MKLTAVMMVRDEADILPLNLAHHRAIGVEEFRIVDNGSSDATPRLLGAMSRRDPSIRWIHEPGAFRQSEIMTELAQEAARDGAEWVMAIDADEFWLPGRPLAGLLRETRADRLSVEVVNLIQHRSQHRPSLRGLLTMTRRAMPPLGAAEAAESLVTNGKISYVETQYTPKLIHRAREDVVVHPGNHEVPGRGRFEKSAQVVCLHAPLRARSILDSKLRNASRLREAGWGAGQVWQWHWWSDVAERGDLDSEWNANSYFNTHLDLNGAHHELLMDTRLRDALTPLLGFFVAA